MSSDILILVGLIVLSAFYSASETAFVTISNSKVSELVAKNVKNAKLLRDLKKDPHKLLITSLIGSNLVNVGASAYAAVIFTNMFGSSGVGIATGVMTFFILIFGDMTPKSFAHEYAPSVALFFAKPIYLSKVLFYPAIWFLDKIVRAVNKLAGGKKMYSVTEGELMAMLKIGAEEGTIEKQERELIENVLEFNDIEVEEVMTPRVAIEGLDSEMTIQESVDFANKHSHSRMPVYKDSIDNIVGIISIRELLKYFDECSPNKKLKTLKLVHPLEVPLSKKINKLFREFQRRHLHMAVVIDEYGGTAGLVTLEDLLEEIVGDIADEFDMNERPFDIIDGKNIIASGGTLIEDVNDFFKMKFAQNDHDTINTFLTEYLHRFPQEGETIKFPRAKVLVLKMKKKTVGKVRITKIIKKTSTGT